MKNIPLFTNKKPTVLFCINNLGVGGAEKVFIRDANTLTEKGYEVFFGILFGNREDQKLISSINIKKENIFFCRANKLYDFKALRRFSNFIKENKISIVYSTLNEANIFARLTKFFSLKIKIFIREANIANQKPIKFKFLDIILNIFVKNIVCVSKDVKSSLTKYLPFYTNKMVILANGVVIPEKQKQYSDKIDTPLSILNVGSLSSKKGQKFLIEAINIINKKKPNSVKLTIIGEGSEEDLLREMITKYELDKLISIIPPITNNPEKYHSYYLNSDIFVLSSLHEGSPNVLLRAMAFGLTSISTRVSGATDMIEDKVSGLLIPKEDEKALAESILYLIENKSKLAIYGENGRKRMKENFSSEKHIEKLQEILK